MGSQAQPFLSTVTLWRNTSSGHVVLPSTGDVGGSVFSYQKSKKWALHIFCDFELGADDELYALCSCEHWVHSLNWGNTLHRATLNWGKQCIIWRAMARTTKMDTKCRKTLDQETQNQDPSVFCTFFMHNLSCYKRSQNRGAGQYHLSV